MIVLGVLWHIVGAVALIVGIAGVPADVAAWSSVFKSLETNTWRWIIVACGTLMTVPFSALFFFTRIKEAHRAHRAEQRYMTYATACEKVGRTIDPAIDKARVQIAVTRDILTAFERTCPEGRTPDGGYDGPTLASWMNYNIAYLLVHHRAQLRRPENKEDSLRPYRARPRSVPRS